MQISSVGKMQFAANQRIRIISGGLVLSVS